MKLIDRVASIIVEDLSGGHDSLDEQFVFSALHYRLKRIAEDKEFDPRIQRIFDKYNKIICDTVDDQIFKCCVCDWWCETHEQADDCDEPTCEDCA